MTIVFEGDPEQLERYAAENHDHMQGITEQAKQHGLIAHRFYGAEGKAMVIDEWPDAESFKSFFEAAGPQIQPLMEAAGVTSEPTPIFWRKLDTHDDVGWDA
ncbi:MAG: hypothetical protein ACXVRE_08300 [Gaiellaceae bacterium]